MRWTERQRAMLEEIGVRLWSHAARTPTALAQVAPPAPVQPSRSAPASTARCAAAAGSGTLATLDWPELAALAAACTACPLCAGRTNSVFGAGHRRAEWMIVGDAPEADDNRSGEPFAGRAGQLLDNMLGALGLTRGEAAPSRQVYVTHAVKCRPP